MADLESNIRLNVDTSDALASLKLLQGQISQFQRQMARTSAANADSARKLRQGLVDDINATGRFSASMTTIRSTSETFTNALEKNKLSLGEYFRYAGGSTKTFGRLFKKEYDTIGKVARERVKDLQTQYIALGRDAGGALKGLAVRPLRLDMENLGTQTAIAAQRQQMFNQLLRQGSTNLLNFGKNTQWAGRQLMVGFTIPLSIFGGIASKTFMEIEEQAIRFRRVYGDAMTTASQTDEALNGMRDLANGFTKYGVEISKTLELAADAAQMGLQGADLREQVANATRLAVLGEVEQQEALKTSVALTNTFGIATQNLADKINFLNIVENETMTAISDLTIAIPKAGPAVTQLGGSVEDLAFFLTAMKEGGINASEGANALKSGLASIINPTRQSVELLKLFNVNITDIRDANRGDIKGLFFDLADALDALDPGQRAQAIEQLFGKFQFSRVSTLLQNIVREGSQAQRVLELTNSTTEELAKLSDRELRRVEESTTFRFRSAVEQFQEAIAPIGEEFLKLITPLIEFGTKIVNQFNNLSDGAKQFITGLTVLLGAVGPVAIMTFGLLANGVANIIKGFAAVRSIFLGLGKQTNVLGEQLDYMNSEQLQAAAVAASLDQTHSKLIQTFTSETGAVKLLADAYRTAWKAQQQFDTGRRITSQAGFQMPKFASGGLVQGPGSGTSDSIAAMVSNGEFIVSARRTKQYLPLLQAIAEGKVPGFKSPDGGTLVGATGGASAQVAALNATSTTKQQLMLFVEAIEGGAIKIDRSSEVLAATLADLAQDTKISLKKFFQRLAVNAEEIAQQTVGNQVNKFAQGTLGQKGKPMRYSASGVGTIQQQLIGAGRADELSRAKLRLDAEAALGLPGQIQIDRAHRVPVSNAEKMFRQSWTADAFNPQTHSENAISNALAGDNAVKGFREKYQQRLDQMLERGEIQHNEYISMLEKINNNLALSESELSVQANILDQITAEEQEFLQKNTALNNDVQRARAGARVPGALKPGAGQISPEMSKDVRYGIDQAKRAGAKAMDSVTDAVVDGVRKKADSKSPSRKADKAGQEITEGALQGIKRGQDDAVVAGEELAKATVRGVTRVSRRRVSTDPNAIPANTQSGAQKRSRRATSGGIMTPDPATGRYVVSTERAAAANTRMADSTNIAATATKRAGINLGSLNGMIMNGTFALTSLAGAGMFMEGAIGEISNKIFAFSGILFGLMQITQLLTQAKLAELVATRMSIARAGMARATVMATRAGGVLGPLAKVGIGLTKFLGPIGIVTAGLAALGGIIGFIVASENKRKKALEGFAETANLAADKLDYLASKFGVTATSTDFSQPIVPGQEADTGPTPGQLRSDDEFLKKYEDQINSLRSSTTDEAIQQIEGLAMKLDSQGFAASTIQTLTTALLQEAEKGSIVIPIFQTNEDGTLVLDVDPAKTARDLADRVSAAAAAAARPGQGGNSQNKTNEALSAAVANQVAYSTSALEQLRGELQAGEIEAEDYQNRLADVFGPIENLEGEALTKVLDDLAESMNIDVSSITNDYDKVLAAKAAVAGVQIDDSEVKILNMGGKEAVEIRKRLNEEIQNQAQNIKTVTEAAQAQAVIDEQIAAARLDLANQNVALEDQIAAYDILIEQGYDLADAITYATNATIAQGLAAAESSKDFEALFDLIDKNKILTDKADNLFRSSSGTAEKTPLQLATESLKQQQTELKNTSIAYGRLRDSGMAVADAMKLAEDSTIAAGIASTKVGTAAWRNLLDLINKTNAALQAGAVKDLLKSQAVDIDLLNQQTLVSSALQQLGYSYEQIQTILANNTAVQQLALDLKDGKLELVESIELLENFQAIADQGVSLNLTTKEGAAQEFQKLYDQATGFLEAQKAVINVDFQLATQEDQSIVTAAQNDIALINYAVDDLEAQLKGIEEQEQEITDVYDGRIEALEEVEKINERIAAQEKAQLTIADALSQGDIAAAAKAAQEMRKEQAAQQIDQQKEALNVAKEQAIANIRSADGRTRIQIENEIKILQDEIFEIEESRLEVAQENIRLAEVERDKKLSSLDAQILKWDELSARVNESKLKLTDDEMQAMKDQAEVIADMLANWDSITDKTATLTVIKTTQAAGGGSGSSSVGSGGGGGSVATESPKTFDDVAARIPKGLGIAELTPGEMETTAPIAAMKVPNIKAGNLIIAGMTPAETQRVIAKQPKPSVNTPSVRQLLNSAGVDKTLDSKAVSKAAPRVRFLARGGMALGSDTVPAMLTPGEFVMSRYAVQKYGVDKLSSMNSGTSGSDSVYNYNLAVNVKSDANPNEIARVVMGQIKQVESQRLRSNRF